MPSRRNRGSKKTSDYTMITSALGRANPPITTSEMRTSALMEKIIDMMRRDGTLTAGNAMHVARTPRTAWDFISEDTEVGHE